MHVSLSVQQVPGGQGSRGPLPDVPLLGTEDELASEDMAGQAPILQLQTRALSPH